MHRRRLSFAVLVVAVCAVVFVAVRPGHRPESLDDRVSSVAAQLRCPVCAGESVADSTSDVAEGMRAEVRQQLAEGRTPQHVLAWFRQRYGASVVMSPSGGGHGWLLWAVPAAIVIAAGSAALLRRRRAEADGDMPSPPTRRPLPASRLGAVALAVVIAGVGVPLLVVHGSSGPTAAASAELAPVTSSATSTSAGPAASSPQQRIQAAFRQLKANHPLRAERMADGAARLQPSLRPYALLVRGLAERAEGRSSASRTLRRFLGRYPHSPVAGQVRRLLRRTTQHSAGQKR